MDKISHSVPEICLIAPSGALAKLTREIARELNLEIGIYKGVLDDGVKIAEKLVKRGAKVFISRKGTATLLSESGYNVAKINTTLNDYLRHLNLMKEHNGKIAIVEFHEFLPELQKLCDYLEVKDAEIFAYSNAYDYEISVENALNSHASILLGGGETLPKEAKRLNIPHTIVENTEQSIKLAIETAIQLLRVQKEEAIQKRFFKIQFEQYSAVVNNSTDAILSTNDTGMIVISNQKAKSLFKVLNDKKQHNLQDILPMLEFDKIKHFKENGISRIVKINEKLLSAKEMPIFVNQRFEGAIVLLQDVQDIQDSEQKIRLHLYEKGHKAKYDFDDIIGQSEVISKTKMIANSYAKTQSSVLIIGETGTGKELFAQSIHKNSNRRKGPFVAINCAALPKELLSSELFGYEEGAFSGAIKGGKAGIFEVAHGGTIFLDEIGEIPLETQIQLLRVLQEKEVRRLSSDKVIPVDVRIICATNKNLSREVEENRFRMDLYYRINVLKLKIPSLRERREDIPLLVAHFIKSMPPEITTDIRNYMINLYPTLMAYQWPGNIRELQGVMERIVAIFTGNKLINPELDMLIDMPKEERPVLRQKDDSAKKEKTSSEKISLDSVRNALELNRYNKQKTAESLNISRSTLWRLMHRYDLYE